MAFFDINYILQKFCPCKKNDKYQVCRDPFYIKALNAPTLQGATFHTANRKWQSQSHDWSWLASLWIELIASHLIVFDLKRERCERALQNLSTLYLFILFSKCPQLSRWETLKYSSFDKKMKWSKQLKGRCWRKNRIY